MSTHDYFGEVGVWKPGSGHVVRSYVLGLAGSLVLTLLAYMVAVQHLVSKEVLVPLVLTLACLQFMVQVLGFLHVNAEQSSRARLIALGCSTVIILVLVIGSMWIMDNLEQRMTFDEPHIESYMQRQRGI